MDHICCCQRSCMSLHACVTWQTWFMPQKMLLLIISMRGSQF